MESIKASEFKAKCLALFDEVAEKGTTYVVTKRGKPVARVVPTTTDEEPGLERLKGTVKILGDIVSPAVPESDWDVLRDDS